MADGNSILDKILASKEDQEKKEFNPFEVIGQLLLQLNEKEADVLKRRYGLGEAPKETLEAIGASYKVTRERIRQIENLAVKKIKQAVNFQTLMKPVEHVVVTVLEEHGGVMNEQHLLEELFPIKRTPVNDQAMIFLLSDLIDHRVSKLGPDTIFMRGWRLKSTDLDFVTAAIDMLQECIRSANTPQDIVQLYELVRAHSFYKLHETALSEKAILAFLEVSNQIDRNPFDEYGLREWGSIVPKRMNDKIYLVLKKVGKPMHFVDIARKITEVFSKEAYPPTVHNELILNQHYVLVGRGIYALREWGYQKGVVADVIAEIVRAHNKPMSREEIVDAVLKQRIVKKNTIHLALTNKAYFSKLPDGRYALTTQSA
ncbi:MAG: sigma-70 region 4 protein [uncultured bacterium]|nr:MAG: sigma-70 region 4 protein [uncultured bacterium]